MTADNEGRGPVGGIGRPLAAACAILATAALCAAVAIAWQTTHSTRPLAPVGSGHRVAVTLVTGQVYYGIVEETTRWGVLLSDVYYVQSVTPAGGQSENRLVSRARNDWHAPSHMSVPMERILYLEDVRPDSRLSKLIDVDKGNEISK